MKTRSLLVLLLLLTVFLSAVEIPKVEPGVSYISISVTGYVTRPGSYQLLPTHRLSDALDAAMLAEIPATSVMLTGRPERNPWEAVADSILTDVRALRSIKLIRAGKTTVYDLQRFYVNGELDQNPLLRDGDVINVPTIARIVSIQGMVYKPGEYEFKPGDTLQNLLELARGLKQGADLSKLVIYRYSGDMQDFQVITLDLSKYPADPSVAQIALSEGDRIMIPENSQYRRKWNVTVSGQVNSPGEYLIDGKTTVYDILTQAGGLTQKGDAATAIYLSKTYNESYDQDFLRLKDLYMNQMTPLEYNYMRSRIRQIKGKYSVDIARIIESKGTEGNVTLRDGDIIYVPEKMDMIWVSGQVVKPGMLEIVAGKDWKYYIAKAGGFTNNRRSAGIRIIRHSSGNWVKPTKDLVLKPGDIIFVPEKTDREFWTDVKDIFLLATQVITIVIGVRALTLN
ncbi:MAG TPA: SLBB domain-containing protein [Candidatus Cloacimonadota bacterium]|nr:SLBB domain-containing protein [Candidatus Cloacimonadota bacterium]